MKMYTLKNEWDGQFRLTGTLEDLIHYFNPSQECLDIEDLLEWVNDEKNGTTYYVFDEYWEENN